MTVTQIDLDGDALAEGMRLSGARSKKDGEPRTTRVCGSAPPHRRTRSLCRRRSDLGLRGLAENALGQQGSLHVMRYLADSSAEDGIAWPVTRWRAGAMICEFGTNVR
jgi:hypothetical protein